MLQGIAGLGSLLSSTHILAARAADETLVVGVLLPRTGYLAGSGDSCFEGVRLAQRLLPRLGLPKFAIVEADTGETPESAVMAAQLAIDRGAHVLIGCYDSGQTVVVAALAERRRVPMIVNVAAAPSITQQGYRYIFRNFPEAHRIVADSYALQKQLFEKTKFTPRKVVVLHINNGRGIEAIQEMWSEMHMPYEMAAPIAYDPKAADLSKEVAAARASDADALWTVSRADDAIRIARELIEQDWTPSILMSSNAGLHDPAYRDALGLYADYAITFAPYFDPNKNLTKRLQRAQFDLAPHTPLGTLQAYTFEAVLIAMDAFRRARSADPDLLAAALRATDIKNNVTPGPGISFDAKGQNTSLGLIAIQNLRGAACVVLPDTAAQASPVLPMPAWSARRIDTGTRHRS